MMLVLGADLSFTRTGLVWLDDTFKLIHYVAFPIKPGSRRLYRACRLFADHVAEHKPDLCVIEDNAYQAPSRVLVVKLSMLNTLLKFVCEAKSVDWLEISPSMVKKFATGSGKAEKVQVASEIKTKYKIAFPDDPGYDLSDAAAIAAWGVEHRWPHAKKR